MRSVLVVVGLLAATAAAEPIRDDILDKRARDADQTARSEAARALAARARAGTGVARAFAKRRAISDHPEVRVPLIDMLVELEVIPKASAAFVPTERVMTQMIRKLLPKERPAELPPEEWCQIEGGDARGVTIVCPVNRCIGNVHERRTYTFTTGVRWTVAAGQRVAADDGTCGDVMQIE